jgi:hypothetical protein
MGARGHTLVELAVAASITLCAMMLGTGMFVNGLKGWRSDADSWTAMVGANRAVEAIARELRDASYSTVVLTSTQPDRITFQRCRGYNATASTDADKRMLTPAITYRKTAVPGKPGEFCVERVEGTGDPVRVAPYVTALAFTLEKASEGKVEGITIDLTVQPPGGTLGPPAPFRVSSLVAIEAP